MHSRRKVSRLTMTFRTWWKIAVTTLPVIQRRHSFIFRRRVSGSVMQCETLTTMAFNGSQPYISLQATNFPRSGDLLKGDTLDFTSVIAPTYNMERTKISISS